MAPDTTQLWIESQLCITAEYGYRHRESIGDWVTKDDSGVVKESE